MQESCQDACYWKRRAKHRQLSAVNAAIALTTGIVRPRILTLTTRGRAGKSGSAPTPSQKQKAAPRRPLKSNKSPIGLYRTIDVSELVTAIGLPALMTRALWV